MRERDPLNALSMVLRSVDAVRNTRALFVLLATFAGAGLLLAMAESTLARDASGWWGNVYWQVITARNGKPLVLVAQKEKALGVAQAALQAVSPSLAPSVTNLRKPTATAPRGPFVFPITPTSQETP